MIQGPTIYHNGTPYDADFNTFYSLSPLLQQLYAQNSYIPMYIKDGLSDEVFQNLVTSINGGNCISVIKSKSVQEIISFLEGSIVYQIHPFIEDVCQIIITQHEQEAINALSIISQCGVMSKTLDQYFVTNLKFYCNHPHFSEVDFATLQRFFELANKSPETLKDKEINAFILNYVKKKQSKEYCLLFQYSDFKCIYEIDGGNSLEELISNNLIDFDLLGEKIISDLRIENPSRDKENSEANSYTSYANIQIDTLESKIGKSEKELQKSRKQVEELLKSHSQLQGEIESVESRIDSARKQAASNIAKINGLKKERAELEDQLLMLVRQEEEIRLKKYEDELQREETSSVGTISDSGSGFDKKKASDENASSKSQQSADTSMPLWCPRAPLEPPSSPFDSAAVLKNIKRLDELMWIYPTEALVECFRIFSKDVVCDDQNFALKLNDIAMNDRATMLDFLARAAAEFDNPELPAALAALLAATDSSCDDLAAQIFLRAAEKNVPEAMLNVAVMARLGRGVAQDDRFAAEMIVKAANLGFAQAIKMAKLAS